MSVMYEIIEDEIIMDNSVYKTYGIVAKTADGELIVKISDITLDCGKAEQFAALCNELSLSPEHLCYAVEDFVDSLE